MSRFFKQALYGGTFLFLVLSVVGIFSYSAFKPEPSCFDGILNQDEVGIDCDGVCLSCARQALKPLVVSPVFLYEIENGLYNTLIEIRNVNTRFGLPRFSYRVDFFDAAGVIQGSFTRETFIYPGEIKYIVETALPFDKALVRGEVSLMPADLLTWEPEERFFSPKATVRNIQYQENSATGELAITGLVVNESGRTLGRVTVNAILVNEFKLQRGYSKTLIEDLQPFEERFFRIVVPAVEFATINRDATRFYLELERPGVL
ncbi:MAG: hypothetical protein COU08_01675 [Candidatus Harrisonbacteria bacterium CG10_big_fil_rev_8_21_14_0_10_42_17]|uniref:Uncharacterized protein n=1 Tax=Candidatus Harrisonbacteria bacterium CG10_big_fil_rev_8_21_14_0_10_42_17 TaxID=1974584 RepID=A0A2M6WIU1_9BACT|nr:MAG: hypothetical protein COU08_01675 [Candidatus Harrisonbacteria bacterium CG10_big_fil_rev_8_21_14_0_10_42_17]